MRTHDGETRNQRSQPSPHLKLCQRRNKCILTQGNSNKTPYTRIENNLHIDVSSLSTNVLGINGRGVVCKRNFQVINIATPFLVWGLVNPEMFSSVADMIEDVMQASLPGVVENVRIASISQGSNPIRILSVRALPDAEVKELEIAAKKSREGKDETPDEAKKRIHPFN